MESNAESEEINENSSSVSDLFRHENRIKSLIILEYVK
jgi:hypothetical protein